MSTAIATTSPTHDPRPARVAPMGALVGPLLAGAVFLGAACRPPPERFWHDEEQFRWRGLDVQGRQATGFTLLAPSKTGVSFANSLSDELAGRNSFLANGSGVALGDIDGDGLVDIYLASIQGPNALYRNLGGWHFEEVAEARGVTAPNRHSTGVVFADVDGDRDLDLLILALGGPNTLFLNDGTGHFRAAPHAGLDSKSGSTTAALADVDRDGDLDLYVANYKVASVTDIFPPRALKKENTVEQTADGDYRVATRFRRHFRIERMTRRGTPVRVERAEPDRLYLNDGTGRFEPVSFTDGRFLDPDGQPLNEPPDYFALAARFADLDGNGSPDLYVCNDFQDPDFLWLNAGDGTFRQAPRLALRTTSYSTMAVAFADVDRSGTLDIFQTDMLSPELSRRKRLLPVFPAPPKEVGQIDDRPQWTRNSLFLNRGDTTLAQLAEFAGVEASDWSWGTEFVDVDLDGYEDLLIATGHRWDHFNVDISRQLKRGSAEVRTEASRAELAWRIWLFAYPPLLLKNVAFRNRGDSTFEDMSEEWGFGVEPDISHGLALADLDGDGDLDVVVNRLNAPAALYRNDAAAPRLAVRLVGRAPNTQAVGAKIRVRGGPVAEQLKEVTVGGLYASGSDPIYSFATGSANAVTVVIDWPSGTRSVIEGVRPNRLVEIREPPARAARAGADLSPLRRHFSDVTPLLAHVHRDSQFNDYRRQRLLPNKLSQLGPGITWSDVDGDGREDLLVPSGSGGRLAYYRNGGDRFTRVDLLVAEHDQTSVLPLPHKGNGADLLVGQASYEEPSPERARQLPAVVRVSPQGGAATPLVPALPGSIGPLALADIDGDRDLDLFVGGRVVPGSYPLGTRSELWRNEGVGFVRDTASVAVLSRLGMVSAAVFTDFDQDGDPDLVLAVDWGPLTVLRNREGRFTDVTNEVGLGDSHSRWNGVAAGDLDGDGRLDLLATSWGRNTKYRVSAEDPMWMYFGDFDADGTVDLLETQYDGAIDGLTPLLESHLHLWRSLPYTRRHVRDAATYATATIGDVLGQASGRARRLEITTVEHFAFLNRGGSHFDPLPLPGVAQLAPAFGIVVQDLDGDGHEDVFLAQNFFPTDWNTPRYDAGRGLWLRGDGTGRLTPVPGRVSGITVYGEQRGAAAADYDGDGRVDLAVTQNGSATKLYRNVGAEPGVRVRLVGPRENRYGVGAHIRLAYGDSLGPVRELHAGSGYWSMDGAVQVLGGAARSTGVRVRWPWGGDTLVALAGDAREVTVKYLEGHHW